LTALDRFLNGNPVSHPAEWVLPLKLLELSWSVLVQKLVERKESTTYTDLDVVLFNFDHDSLSTKLVDSLRFSHKHNFEFLAIRVVINVLGELFVGWIVFHWNVDRDTRFQVDDVLMQHVDLVLPFLDFELRIFQLLEHIQLGGLGVVEFFLELHYVRRCTLELFLEFCFGHLNRVVVCLPCAKLVLNIIFLSKLSVQLKDS